VRRQGFRSALEVFLFAASGVTGFLLVAVNGRPHLDAEMPMRVRALVVANTFPLVAVLAVMALPLGAVDRRVGFFAESVLAATVYMVSIAAVIRIAKVGRGRGD